MEYNIVYVVIREGEVEYASTEKENADNYADAQSCYARQAVLDEWGNDDPTAENIAEADFQAGFNGDYYEVEELDISKLSEDDKVELSDGNEIDVFDILEKLKNDE